MAMTFDPHPPRVVRPDKAPPLLMTKTQRLDALPGVEASAMAKVPLAGTDYIPGITEERALAEIKALLGKQLDGRNGARDA